MQRTKMPRFLIWDDVPRHTVSSAMPELLAGHASEHKRDTIDYRGRSVEARRTAAALKCP
jgi:hypothetical protein